MKKTKKKTAADILASRVSKLKRKAVKKVLVTVVLPGAITVLGTAAVKTWLRVMLRRVGENTEPEAHGDGGDGRDGDASRKESRSTQDEPIGTDGDRTDDGRTGDAKTDDAKTDDAKTDDAKTDDIPRDCGEMGNARPEPVPVMLPTFRPEFVTPEPVSVTHPTSETDLFPR